MKFVDLKHIQLFISFLELLENPQDWLAWEVLLQAIPNIGEHLTQVIIRDLQAKSSPASVGRWPTWTTTSPPRCARCFSGSLRQKPAGSKRRRQAKNRTTV